jgi:hypothetical protein
MNPKTIGALVFVALAGAGAWWQLSRDDENLEKTPPNSPLPGIAAADIDEVVVTDAVTATSVTLARGNGGWQMTAPVDDAADATAVDEMLEALAAARVNPRPSATSQESWPSLNVGSDEVITVALRQTGTDVATLHIGKDGKFVRLGDAPEVYELKGVSRMLVAKEPRLWRDRKLIKYDRNEVTSVEVTDASGARVAADRTPAPEPAKGAVRAQDTWTLTAGQQLAGNLDPGAPIGVVARTNHLLADDFADGVTRADAGLAPPAVTVTVHVEGGAKHAVEIGASTGEERVYVSVPGSERVWLLSKAAVDAFARPPLQWRDKTIAKLAGDDVAKIDIRNGDFRLVAIRGDAGWTVAQPKGATPGEGVLDGLAGAMSNLRGAAIATDTSPKSTGLGKPTVVARYTTKDRTTVELTIGAQDAADKTWYARASTRDDIVLIPDHLVARLRVSRESVEGKPPTP